MVKLLSKVTGGCLVIVSDLEMDNCVLALVLKDSRR